MSRINKINKNLVNLILALTTLSFVSCANMSPQEQAAYGNIFQNFNRQQQLDQQRHHQYQIEYQRAQQARRQQQRPVVIQQQCDLRCQYARNRAYWGN